MKNISTKASKNNGFTLVEILVALAIFALVMVTVTTAMLAVMDANAKSRSIRNVMDNLSSAVENISRTLRFGTQYDTENCGGNCIKFISQEGNDVTYSLSGGVIYRFLIDSNGVGSGNVALTSSDNVNISSAQFNLIGTGLGSGQPRVHIVIKGSATTAKVSTEFTIQTTVSERKFQLNPPS